MYQVFAELLDENNIKTNEVAKATNIPASTFTDWKKGKSSPKPEKLQKIADYFNVSIEYLLTGKERDSRFSEEDAHLVAKIRRSEKASKVIGELMEMPLEKREKVLDVLEMLISNEK